MPKSVLRIVEGVRSRLVDRRRARPRRGVGDLPRVQRERLEAEFAVSHSLRFYRRLDRRRDGDANRERLRAATCSAGTTPSFRIFCSW